MDWRDVPSLLALRALEATARTGSFSAAARELNVTHAAVAQHVRTVEEHLGTALMVRSGRGMELTAPGAALAETLSEGFGTIIAGVRAVTDDAEARPLAMTLTPSFAENWLMPRLGHFWAAHPEITLSITPSMEVVDLRRDGFDIGIRYGYGDWPGVTAEYLVSAEYVVVASPALLKGRKPKTMQALQDFPWLFAANYSEAKKWAVENDLDMRCCQIKELATAALVHAAVRGGVGVSILSRAIAEADIAAGHLKALFTVERPGLGYYTVTHAAVPSARVKTLVKWLRSQAAESAA